MDEQLTGAISGLKKALVSVMVFSLCINLLMLTAPIYMLQVFDRVLASKSYETLGYLSLITFIALFVYLQLEIIRAFIMQKTAHWFVKKIDTKSLLISSWANIRPVAPGSSVVKDLAQIKQFLSSSATCTFFDVPWIPIYLLILFYMHPVLGIASTVGAILIFTIAVINQRLSAQLQESSMLIEGQNRARLEALYKNLDIIQAMGLINRVIHQWRQEDFLCSAFQIRAAKLSSIMTYSSRFLRFIMQIVILGLGAYYVIEGELTPGMMIAGSIVMSRALAPIEQSIGSWSSYIQSKAAYYRIREHLKHTPPEYQSVKMPRPKGHLTVENLSFMVPNRQEMLLKHISFELCPGEILGIIGPSASGKSTLGKLLIGLLTPSLGKIRLDGVDVTTWDRVELGEYIGYVPQSLQLMPDTIANNIARMQDEGSEKIIEAAQLSNAHELILSLSSGYNTFVGEGSFLSGGQQQRIALARAMYGKPPLIVLDEPNSNLDMQGEVALLDCLENLKKLGGTVIVISHRNGILKVCDKLALLDQGQLLHFGDKDEVLKAIVAPQEGKRA